MALLTTIFLVGFVSLVTKYALANKEPYSANPSEMSSDYLGYDDNKNYEFSIEWLNSFKRTENGVVYNDDSNDDSCQGLSTILSLSGWEKEYEFTQGFVWEEDFKSYYYGGVNDSYPDSVDISMLCGIGSLSEDEYYGGLRSSLEFLSPQDDYFLTPGDAERAYGDKDLEWLAFDASGVLRDDDVSFWASSFNGLHLLLGFRNSMYNNTWGNGLLWGFFMVGTEDLPPSTVTQAWFQVLDWTQPVGTCARVVAEDDINFNDHLWGKGFVSADLFDTHFSYWDHCASYLAQPELNNHEIQPVVVTMPIVQTVNRTVNEDYVQNTVAPAFNMTGAVGMDDRFFYMSDITAGITQTLLVDRVTGSYSFVNQSRLWTTPIYTPTLPSAQQAASIITHWFDTTPAENLPAMQYRNPVYYQYSTEDIVRMMKAIGGINSQPGQELSRLPANVSMIYPRTILATAKTTNGLQQMEFPMFGPGARMKVYLGDQGEIVGVQGGSRDVQVMSDQVIILDPSKVWTSYLANPDMAIPQVPIVADYITYTNYVLGYYEMPYLQTQNELIPVYDFSADFYTGTQIIAEGVDVFLPASVSYLPPQVAILNPEDGATFWAGEPISLEGWINHGTPPYSIEWSSSSDGFLGDTLNIIAGIGSSIRSNTVFNPTVSFTVTDANGLTNTATISLAIKPIFWLPLITK
jgi:hypothetical protein